jgi:hypothetical protein
VFGGCGQCRPVLVQAVMSRVPDRAGHRITTVGSITGSANRGSGLAGVLAVMLAALIAVLAPVPAVASGGPVPSPGHRRAMRRLRVWRRAPIRRW